MTDDHERYGATPTAPIAIACGAEHARSHFGAEMILPAGFLDRLAATGCELLVSGADLADASRDWWPLGMIWSTTGQVPAQAGALARPANAEQVAAVHRICSEFRVPITPCGGRSGVLGSSVPVYGGLLLDTTRMVGIVSVDDQSGLVTVLPGTFGHEFEAELQSQHKLTVGHWPQSMDLSTVGGWVACRGAGQLSTRYGKIEDLVAGLSVVLADGTLVHTGGFPRAAAGPDLTQLFVGSEGTLGTIVSVTLRARPLPTHVALGAWGFTSFEAGLDAMRRISRRGATPAVFRLYDAIESDRSFKTGPNTHLLLIRDEGERALVEASMAIVFEELDVDIRNGTCELADPSHVDSWMEHRNDVTALERLISGGYVVDTMEVSGSWSTLSTMYAAALDALRSVPGNLVASAHQSHSYLDGGCLYFTFAGKGEPDDREAFYLQSWDAAAKAIHLCSGSLSHHHGIGINRQRFMAEYLGTSHDVLNSIRSAVDPHGICNPGKLGLRSDGLRAIQWPSDLGPNAGSEGNHAGGLE